MMKSSALHVIKMLSLHPYHHVEQALILKNFKNQINCDNSVIACLYYRCGDTWKYDKH